VCLLLFAADWLLTGLARQGMKPCGLSEEQQHASSQARAPCSMSHVVARLLCANSILHSFPAPLWEFSSGEPHIDRDDVRGVCRPEVEQRQVTSIHHRPQPLCPHS
jgi:hypothetical protein